MLFHEVESLPAIREPSFQLFIFDAYQDLLEERTRPESFLDQVFAGDKRLGKMSLSVHSARLCKT